MTGSVRTNSQAAPDTLWMWTYLPAAIFNNVASHRETPKNAAAENCQPPFNDRIKGECLHGTRARLHYLGHRRQLRNHRGPNSLSSTDVLSGRGSPVIRT